MHIEIEQMKWYQGIPEYFMCMRCGRVPDSGVYWRVTARQGPVTVNAVCCTRCVQDGGRGAAEHFLAPPPRPKSRDEPEGVLCRNCLRRIPPTDWQRHVEGCGDFKSIE